MGEKRVLSDRYELGDWCDDVGWTDHWDPDIIRYTGSRPGPDVVSGTPLPAGERLDFGFNFGAVHRAVSTSSMPTATSGRWVRDIDLGTFNALGHRSDGLSVTVN